MSDGQFGPTYAAAYDLFYADKNYEAECDLVQGMFAKHAEHPVRRVLDLGCGTGRHSCILAARGYDVVGVDRSEDMLQAARARAADDSVAVKFVVGDLRNVAVGGEFDAALMMFAVLGYQTTDADLTAALTNARRHLVRGGVFVFDVWYAPAVLTQAPEERWRFYRTEAGGVIRYSNGTVLADRSVCVVDLEVWSVAPGHPAAEHVQERHEMRFFTREGLAARLSDTGFRLVDAVSFPGGNRDPDESSWNVLVTATTA